MAIESVQLRLNGYLQVDQVSNTSTRAYARTLKRVRLNIVGLPPQTDLQLRALLGGVLQAQTFTWLAGAPSADIPVTGDGLVVPAQTGLAFQVTAPGGAADLDIEAVCDSATAALVQDNPDCGLGVLATLKAHILAAALQAGTEYDAALAQIGRGVAAAFDRHCHRALKRLENTVEIFPGGRDLLLLQRYPIESVAAVALRETGAAEYATQTGIVDNLLAASGLLYLTSELGTERALIRVTYTGGYWYDASPDQDGALPATATALPEDLRLAWLLQCGHLWGSIDRLGADLLKSPDSGALLNTRLGNLQLVPQVKEILQPYIRLAIA